VTATVLDADRALVHVKVARTGTTESPTIPSSSCSRRPEGWKLADVLYPKATRACADPGQGQCRRPRSARASMKNAYPGVKNPGKVMPGRLPLAQRLP
jgi:hypothetical protein